MCNLLWALWGTKTSSSPHERKLRSTMNIQEKQILGHIIELDVVLSERTLWVVQINNKKQLRIPCHGAVKEIKWYAKEDKDHTNKSSVRQVMFQIKKKTVDWNCKPRSVVQIPVKSSSITNEVPTEPSYLQLKINQQGQNCHYQSAGICDEVFHGQFGTFPELTQIVWIDQVMPGTTRVRTCPVKKQKVALVSIAKQRYLRVVVG